ncbi:bifunctional DNA-formamidopyrimidine glycosylase/DNA-(apurinic or apyrimidinic site) lyase [Chloroflexota bacterium]
MPELPEVETVKNELSPHIVGHCISSITLFWEGIVRQPSMEEFRSRLIGQEIAGVARRGKYLILSLNGSEELIIHLKMSGSLLLKPGLAEPDKFVRAVLSLDGEMALHFHDPRKFGRMWLVQDGQEIVGKLGPEPLEADFTHQVLVQLLKNRRAPIKAILLDQTIIAGIGNMYADEALFAAKIHPLGSGSSLSHDEVERLHRAIQQVLQAAINNKGASIVNYYRPSGELGTAHFEFKVAHRRGENCFVCGTPLERITVRNRGTYFCPRCQPEP